MKKHGDNLFQIGEVRKILGVSRKALLYYEELGLLTPALKDSETGYRYYSADNMTQIRSIRALQSLGLSLEEVKQYYYDSDNMDQQLQHLMKLRSILDKNIHLMQIRAAKPGDRTVYSVTLPRQVCFCRQFAYESLAAATSNLRNTYIEAARTGHMSQIGKMFTVRSLHRDDGLDYLCCIAVDDSYQGPNRIEFAETPALCIYHKGPYEEIGEVMQVLMAYVKEHNIQTTGDFRSIYLEGPPNRGEHKEDYITQVAVPIKSLQIL